MPLTGPTMTPTVVVPPFNETVVKTLRVRPKAEVTRFGYALELLTTASLAVKAKLTARPSLQYVPLRVKAGISAIAFQLINVSAITYTQSSVYVDNTAATNAGMTDGSYNTGSQTATDAGGPAWIKMDLGGVFPVANVIIGGDYDNVLPGDWGEYFVQDCDVEISTDGTTWTFLFNTGTTLNGTPIATFPVSATGRYIRINSTTSPGFPEWEGYMAVTEFYATST
ncbi:MAG: hypothetical protein RL434_2602 [Pseudomonadota bacterium]|jgi:hypothetical protein